jgi:phosphate transport system substrate-binding protein
MLTNQPGADSWPVAGATFILVHKKPQNPAAVTSALKFFAWAYAHGDKMAEDLVYVPLPGTVKSAIEKMWTAQISGIDTKTLLN